MCGRALKGEFTGSGDYSRGELVRDVLSSRKLPWNARRTPILLVSAVTVTNLHKHAHYPIEPTLCLHAVMIILGQENSFPPLTPQSVCVCMCVSHSVVSDSL